MRISPFPAHNVALIVLISELRTSLDTLKQETDKQAQAHQVVAQAIKADLEGHATAFTAKQQQHKRGIQAQIEKEFKNKQTQEGYVARAREKYEADCMRINSYTAQSTLIQGRDLEKVHLKLERAQQTVQANQRDYANFARALQDTLQKWEHNWKAFCDSCQDLEEERIEFMKDNMWAYANAVSTVCVSDDEVRTIFLPIPSKRGSMAFGSLAKSFVWPWNSLKLNAIWRTLYAITALETAFPTPLPSSTTRAQKHSPRQHSAQRPISPTSLASRNALGSLHNRGRIHNLSLRRSLSTTLA